jgi:hypothetical protein
MASGLFIASGAAVSGGFPQAAKVAVKLTAVIKARAFQFIISLPVLKSWMVNDSASKRGQDSILTVPAILSGYLRFSLRIT